jgi:hypothetical protein
VNEREGTGVKKKRERGNRCKKKMRKSEREQECKKKDREGGNR